MTTKRRVKAVKNSSSPGTNRLSEAATEIMSVLQKYKILIGEANSVLTDIQCVINQQGKRHAQTIPVKAVPMNLDHLLDD